MSVKSISPKLANILPYTLIVGQERVKLALELAYIAPRIGGVLLSGQRGTAKSTAVRAFTRMMYDKLPVTLPINATEDRVVGGWRIDKLMQSKPEPQPGLLKDADKSLLYIDEVNLLDDHIVNIILDVTSTGVLEVQRDGQNKQLSVSFTLVGTMNPEEGGLRPQLLDRFGLMVSVTAETNVDERVKILETVLEFDRAVTEFKSGKSSPYINDALQEDKKRKDVLEKAREKFSSVTMPENISRNCVNLALRVQAEGHRGDYIIALAARAYAALHGVEEVTNEHVAAVAQLALQHRHPEGLQDNKMLWNEKYQLIVRDILNLEGD
ncbi:AAA family ATPase [Desmonostoc muscorum LEGE 12446]|uniref:AAA family ATPase n=1 Tax=Desmonostoc muscorum LEGE 12446 TaxID=1828758 RepID=A0A8J6ZNC7_DESMC|nr:AAA family ATPase [Desmonostoc muscorum]MCF2150127.1 AAA family ATPase [Desmonostoc muscorum LEGE 12446]